MISLRTVRIAVSYTHLMNDRGMLSYRNGEIVTERTNKISLLTKPAAVLGSVSCGMPQLEEEYIEEYVSLPVSLFGEGEFFILRASGAVSYTHLYTVYT